MASYRAKWGSKGLWVDPRKVGHMLSLTTGCSRKSDTNNDTSGKTTTNTRGMELQKIKLETRYVAGLGVDPRGQIEEWRNQFGKRYPLLIGGRQFGPDLLELVSVDVSNIQLDNAGRFLSVDISVMLEEYIDPNMTVTQKKADTSAASSTTGALAAAPSSTDKADKKSTVTPVR